MFTVCSDARRRYDATNGEPAFRCPQCWRDFGVEHLDTAEPRLTLEHVPPAAVDFRASPRGLILVCSECNSWAGHELDAELAKRESFVRMALNRPVSFKGTFLFGDKKYRASFDAGDRIVHGEVPSLANHPKDLADLESAFDDIRDGDASPQVEFSIEFPRFDERRADVALLRAGYLACFAKLGYGWAALPASQEVRRQIQEPGVVRLTQFAAVAPAVPTTTLEFGLSRDEAGELFPLLVMGHNLVALPGAHGSATEFYRGLAAAGNGVMMRGKVTLLSWPTGPELIFDH